LFTKKIIPAIALIALAGGRGFAMTNVTSHEVKTYMSYGLPVDPAKVFTLVDLDFSYALASTLVDWDDSKLPVSGLAERWDYTGEKEVTFYLRPKLVWSDGAAITATDVVASFNRAKRLYRDDLKTLFDLVDSIEAKGTNAVVFKLNVPAANSGVIRKLTEPMYGVVAIKHDGGIDYTRTSGPFALAASSPSELEFLLNRRWFKAQPNMAEKIYVRQPPVGEELQEGFLKDKWVNLLTTSSLAPESLKQRYNYAHFTTWNRNLDKVFFMSPGPRLTNDDGRTLVRVLNKKMNRELANKGLSGLQLTDQFFVPGYVLFDPEFKKSIQDEVIPANFRTRPLEILGIQSRLSETLAANLLQAIKEITGITPKLKTVVLGDLDKARSQNDYDFVVLSLPVADANVEGALGYIFGMSPSFIPNADETGKNNFHDRVFDAGKLPEQSQRNTEYRKVFADAINVGSVLPLFHFSTLVIAKEGIDLSSVPETDETVAFSKVHFK
jgi:MarR-like DNA-binding transcriptional regulator SgrR of sgrS sRNA